MVLKERIVFVKSLLWHAIDDFIIITVNKLILAAVNFSFLVKFE